MSNPYQIDKPYPMPVSLHKNRKTGLLLLENYCGAESELTAIHTYVYHNLKSAAEQPGLADALLKIAQCEMHHLHLLGECINLLGVNPKFRTVSDSGPKYWSGRHVNYCETVRELVKADIDSEFAAIKHYENTCRKVQNTQVQKLLMRIIEDEKLHAQALRDFYNKYY